MHSEQSITFLPTSRLVHFNDTYAEAKFKAMSAVLITLNLSYIGYFHYFYNFYLNVRFMFITNVLNKFNKSKSKYTFIVEMIN